MPQLIVVESKKSFTLDVPGAEVVTARQYLTSRRFVDMKRAKVFNLCRNHGYQTLGYYVSLLAAARNHKPLPSLSTMQNLRQSAVVRLASEDVADLIERTLEGHESDQLVLSIYFGRNVASRHDRLSQALFEHFPAPLMRATFQRNGSWRLLDIKAIAMADVPASHYDFLVDRARKYFERPVARDPEKLNYDLAILVNPEEQDAPSDEKALQRFAKAARQLGIRASLIGKEDYGRIAEYDALFIRETTGVNHRTYRFSSLAEKEGLVVIDDPESILRCCNKVYQAEVFEKHGIPCPKTLVVHGGNQQQVAPTLGFPCVLKRPDSSFSQGVVKANDEAELKTHLSAFLNSSELVVAQAYAPSEFDWRVGVLRGRPLYVCRYYMARGHWQIQRNEEGKKKSFGKHETMRVEDAPSEVVDLALRAANLMGQGLYGVDIKESEGRLLVMEVNDNPSIQSGVEDAVLKDELYLTIMRFFQDRIEERTKPAVVPVDRKNLPTPEVRRKSGPGQSSPGQSGSAGDSVSGENS